jgi:hypothetical protein
MLRSAMVSLAALAAAPAVAAAAATLTSSLTHLATPRAMTNLSWTFDGASQGDWLTIRCGAGSAYFSWTYTDGSKAGSQAYELYANGKRSACDTINVALYSAAGQVVAQTADITVAPMIQNVHLSMTNDTSTMVVDFFSSGGGSAPACSYGESPALGSTVAGKVGADYATIGLVAWALLTDLKPATQYYYACTDGVVTSQTYSFVNRPSAPTSRVAVFADFGVDDGFGLAQIAADVGAGAFDFILHAGDWAQVRRAEPSPPPQTATQTPSNIHPPPEIPSHSYNFDSDQSANGNIFMNRAETYSTQFPVQPAPGNHEDAANFAEYRTRHSGVAANSNTGYSTFYSFEVNAGTPLGVHYLAFNSETTAVSAAELAAMTAFMRSDLASVSRARTPWVVAFSHKHWWMDGTDFSSLSSILQDGGVDVLFAGHCKYARQFKPPSPLLHPPNTPTALAPQGTTTSAWRRCSRPRR